jgi:hypothetical protein
MSFMVAQDRLPNLAERLCCKITDERTGSLKAPK